MRSYGQVAAKVRAYKEKHPELYCPDPKCLWRVVTSYGRKPNPCPRHMSGMQEAISPAQTGLTAQNDNTDRQGSGAVADESMSQS